MKVVSKLKFKLINVTGCILLLGEFSDIKLDSDFSARLDHKINMKLINIFVPKNIYMSKQFKSQRRFICLKAIEFKRIVFVLNAGKNMQAKCEIVSYNNYLGPF